MNFEYSGCLIELTLLRIEYPTFPHKAGARAVSVWQVKINDEELKITRGSKQEIISRVKKYIRDFEDCLILEGDDDDDDEDDDFS